MGFTIPFLMHLQCAEKAGFAILNQTRVHSPFLVIPGIPPHVHDYLAQTSFNPTLLDSLRQTVKTIPIREHALEETCRPRLEHLRDRNASSGISILGGEVALQHPDALAEPGHEFEIVGGTPISSINGFTARSNGRGLPEESLSGVHVCAYQAWNHDVACQVIDLFLGIFGLQGRRLANVRDASALHENSAIEDYLASAVYGYDGCVGV
jgi:hypothetical protein